MVTRRETRRVRPTRISRRNSRSRSNSRNSKYKKIYFQGGVERKYIYINLDDSLSKIKKDLANEFGHDKVNLYDDFARELNTQNYKDKFRSHCITTDTIFVKKNDIVYDNGKSKSNKRRKY